MLFLKNPDNDDTGEWSVYIIECRGGRLYTGIAKDVENRFAAHRSGKGAAFTRMNPPLAVLYQEDGYSRSRALMREAEIKRMPAAQKRRLKRDRIPILGSSTFKRR